MSHIESIIVAILTYLVSNTSQPLFRRAEIHLGFLQQLLNSLQRRLHILFVPLPSLEAGIGAFACSKTGLNLTWFPTWKFSRCWGDGRHVTLSRFKVGLQLNMSSSNMALVASDVAWKWKWEAQSVNYNGKGSLELDVALLFSDGIVWNISQTTIIHVGHHVHLHVGHHEGSETLTE